MVQSAQISVAPLPAPWSRRKTGRMERIRNEAVRLLEGPEPHARAWIVNQTTNTARHVAKLHSIRKDEYGKGPAAPQEIHRRAANSLLTPLRDKLRQTAGRMARVQRRLLRNLTYQDLYRFLALKERNEALTRGVEQVWEFYHEIFLQRRTRFAGYLQACDRIGEDCYRAVYTNLGKARKVPPTAPFSFMESTRSPATFRRYVRIKKIMRLPNPMPLVKIPRRRLINPWSLGAVPHEIAHNCQSDLNMWSMLPRAIHKALRDARMPRSVTNTWARWHKEIFADLLGILLIGPAFVASLVDLLSRTPKRTLRFRANAVHPVPYLRIFINLELLRRLGFDSHAAAYRKLWSRLYPRHISSSLPRQLTSTFTQANRLVVDTVCYTPYTQLGDKTLVEVVRFSHQDYELCTQAANRLAKGTNTGILPERFLIPAARIALERRLAKPDVIAKNFYAALVRR